MQFHDEIRHLEQINYTPLDISRFHYHRKHWVKNTVAVVLFVLSIFTAGYYFYYDSTPQSTTAQAAAHVVVQPSPEQILMETTQDAETGPTLQELVDAELEGTTGSYGIAVKHLETGESFFLNEHKKYQTASLYKMWIMTTAYEQIEDGTLKLDEVLEDDVVNLNSRFLIASEDAELKEGRVKFTVQEALEEMITNSHNYASYLLTVRIKLSNVENFLKKHNFKDSNVGIPPQTTPHDMMLFFEKLHNGEFADEEHTEQMIALLKRQNLNNVLPKYLPNYVEVAHKTGQLNMFAHDAGIVYLDGGEYIIAGLSESNAYRDAEDRIALVSSAVYKYFINPL